METYPASQQVSNSKDLSIQPDVVQPESVGDLNFTPLDSFLNTLDEQKQGEIRSMLHSEVSGHEPQNILSNTTSEFNANTLANMGKLMSVAQEVIQEDKNEQNIQDNKENFFQRIVNFFRRLFSSKKTTPQ